MPGANDGSLPANYVGGLPYGSFGQEACNTPKQRFVLVEKHGVEFLGYTGVLIQASRLVVHGTKGVFDHHL